jgi:hypothetical protein
MTKEQALQEQMDEIMDSFEFDKVLSVMQHLNWEWMDYGVPDEYEIRQSARRTMKSAIECNGTSGTGGFTAIVDDNTEEKWVRLSLYFGFGTINDGVDYEKKS